MSYSQTLHSKVREYLITSTDNRLHNGSQPSGAAPTFWMFTLPNAPENNYDEVYPGILMGDSTVVGDKKRLQELGVTHIMNCAEGDRRSQVVTGSSFYRNVRIQYLGMKAQDTSMYNMMPHFKTACEFIEKALKKEGKVYVHCVKGVSRSACIVLAFLMLRRDMELMDAVKLVRKNRKIHPNDGFIRQLCILNQELFGSKFG